MFYNFINRISLTLAILVLMILSSSCQKNEIPQSSLEMRDSLIYKKGSDKPFTGREKARVQDKIIEYDVVDGIKNGEFKLFYEDGTPQINGHIDHNKNTGKWQYFYPGGEIESEGFFVDDKPEGRWVWYYQSGKIREEGSFAKGKRVGWWKDFDEQGKVTKEKEFSLNDSTETDNNLIEKLNPKVLK